MKFLKSNWIIILLVLALSISLVFNFMPETPLFSFSVNYPLENGSGHEIVYIYDSEKNPEDVLATFNILSTPGIRADGISVDFEKPDLTLWRNVPSQGYCDAMYNFHFVNDVAYFWLGNSTDAHTDIPLYALDAFGTQRIKEITKYDPDYNPNTVLRKA